MTKIFSADFRKGSYIDSVNKIVGVPTSLSKLIRTEKGTALARAVDHNGVTYTTGSKSLSKFTIVAWIKQRTTDTEDRYSIAQIGTTQIIRRDFSATGYDNYFGGSSFQGSLSVPTSTSLNKWMQFVVTYDGANLISSVNNKQLVGSPSPTTATLDYTSIAIGRGTAIARYSDSDILKFDVYDDVISDKELELDYKSLLESQVTEKPVRGFELVKPTDLSYEKDRGLLAAYNFKRNGNTLVDISGNGNNGTISGGVVQGKEGLVFDGTTGYVNFANTKLATSDFTVITRVKLNDYPILARNIISTTTLDFGRFLGIFDKSIGLYNGSEWLSGSTELISKQEYTLAYVCDSSAINLYVDGVLDGTGSKGPYNGLSLETIGKWTSDFSRNVSGVIKDIRFYNRALSVQEIKDYHNSFIKPIILEDFSNNGVNNTEIKDWTKQSGAFKISELSVDDSILKHLTTGTKYLECTTEGKLYISLLNTSKFTMEFDVNMTSVGLFSYLYLLNSPMYSTANGYGIGTGYRNMIMRLTAGTSSQLNRTDSGLVLNGVWYSFRLTRTISGVMSLFIRGGVFGQNWTLVNMTGGTGTNPTTDTSHSIFKTAMLVLRAGDKIANLKIYDGVRQ